MDGIEKAKIWNPKTGKRPIEKAKRALNLKKSWELRAREQVKTFKI